jgi:beta-glucosidase
VSTNLGAAFPAGFLWGVATSAFQIEGSTNADGRGETVWDRFVRRPWTIVDGSNANVACDHYRRMPGDVELLRWLGVGAYRFSIAWARVQPTGVGPTNAAGLDFYDRLVDALVAAGIRPFVTLNHWDLPQALEDRGGWGGRETADRFADYAGLVFDRLGDRVAGWITHNEPWCQAFLGHATGHHAPGRCDWSLAYQVAHHLLVGHGLAVQRFRASSANGEIGLAINPQHYVAASDRAADVAARDRVAANAIDLFLEPILQGRYPQALTDWIGPHAPRATSDDLSIIRQPIDFLGVNYYDGESISHDVEGSLLKAHSEPRSEADWGLTEMGWGVAPSGLTAVLLDLKRRFDLPLYLTENGAAFEDPPLVDGHIDDALRVRYLEEHVEAAGAAIRAGADLRGYFCWSLLDNFEWAWGFTKRFGLVHVDFGDQRRTPKRSAHWYRDLIATRSRPGV